MNKLKRTLVYSDPHIIEDDIDECSDIFNEILEIQADRIICIGDYYDKKRPTPKETDFGAFIASRELRQYEEVRKVIGNHDAIDDEINTVEYLSHFMVSICDNFVDENNNLYAHFFTDKSEKSFGTNLVRQDYVDTKHNYTFLGHQHHFQQLSKKSCHLGSIRYLTFGDLTHIPKYVALFDGEHMPELITLESPIKIYDVKTIEELEKLPRKSKVRLTIDTFDYLKTNIYKIEQYKKEFYRFKVKIAFSTMPKQYNESKRKAHLRDIITNWLNQIEVPEVKTELEEQFQILI